MFVSYQAPRHGLRDTSAAVATGGRSIWRHFGGQTAPRQGV